MEFLISFERTKVKGKSRSEERENIVLGNFVKRVTEGTWASSTKNGGSEVVLRKILWFLEV